MDTKAKLDKLKLYDKKEEIEEKEFLLLFISFDLVNSTKFKNIPNSSWKDIMELFYKQIDIYFVSGTKAKELSIDFETWKLLGDEVIVKAEINSINELKESISYCYKILNEIVKTIENNKPLSIKSTAWLALIDGDINHEIKIDKTAFDINYYIKDYIGRSMDGGFRVSSKIARERKLAIDFNIAFLLANNDLSHRVFYLGLAKLKGVWKDRGYPAIWYSEDLEGDRKKTAYDAEIDCEYSKVFMYENNNDILHKLDKIKKDVNPKHLEKIYKFFSNF